MKNNTINNEQVRKVNEAVSDNELSENELDQVNGGFDGYKFAGGVACVLLGMAVPDPFSSVFCIDLGITMAVDAFDD